MPHADRSLIGWAGSVLANVRMRQGGRKVRSQVFNAAARHVVERLEPRQLLSAIPVGTEFRVNTYTTGTQESPHVASDAAGDFVVTWEGYGVGGGWGINAQRYNAAGVAQGSEFRVNAATTTTQGDPAVAMDSAGDFVISWTDFGANGRGYAIYAQRYNAAGTVQGSALRVSSYTTGVQELSCVAMDSAGDFAIAWNSYGQNASGFGIYAQRYNAAGIAQGGNFRVNTYTTGNQYVPSVAMDSAGDFVVAWEGPGGDGGYYVIYAQRYNTAGTAQGSEFQVNTYTTGSPGNPSVAMDSAGDFVITWSNYAQNGGGYHIYAQRYNAAGTAQGGEFQINTETTRGQSGPSVAMDSAGDFVITWSSYLQDGSGYGVYAQGYNSAGMAQGNAFKVNTYTTGNQDAPSVAMDSVGDFVACWQSYGEDGSFLGIYAQRYKAAPATSTAVTSSDGSTIYGQPVTLTATIVPASGSGETGTVQFQVNGSNFGSPVTLSGNTAIYATSTLSVGNDSIVAVYSGDGNFAGSTSPAITQNVTADAGTAPTTTAVTSSSGSVPFGQPVTFTATIVPNSGSGETGVVQFQIDGSNAGIPVTLSGNTAIYTTSTMSIGSHMIAAVYSGDNTFAGSTSPTLTQNITAAGSQFLNVTVLGSTDGVHYSSSQAVTPGETVYYEVELYLAGSGTSNTHQSNPLGTQNGPNIDGVNSISLDLTNSDNTVSGISSTLGAGWGNLTGANAGRASGSSVSGVAAGQSPGTFVGWNQANASIVFIGSFTAGTAATDTVAAKWDTGVATGGIKILLTNGVNKAAPITNATEASSDPYVGYAPLALTAALPAWLAPTSHATWDGTTLTVTGPATIITDPGAAEPLIVASGSSARLTIAPTTGSPADVHVGGITLTNGAGIDVASVGAGRSHGYHNTLVIGTIGAASDPTLSIDSSSTLNLEDNDMIVHTAGNDPTGYAELAAVQGLVKTGRAGGGWNGDGLTSTVAEAQDAGDGFESVQLGVVDNADLGSPFSTWQVGSAVETLGASDIIVKYTYSGDFTFDGEVDFNDTTILGAYFDNGASTGNEWAFGDTNGDGLLNFLDAANFGLEYGNGTGSPNALDPVQL